MITYTNCTPLSSITITCINAVKDCTPVSLNRALVRLWLDITLSVYTANRVFIVMVPLYCVKRYSKKKKLDSEILTP